MRLVPLGSHPKMGQPHDRPAYIFSSSGQLPIFYPLHNRAMKQLEKRILKLFYVACIQVGLIIIVLSAAIVYPSVIGYADYVYYSMIPVVSLLTVYLWKYLHINPYQ